MQLPIENAKFLDCKPTLTHTSAMKLVQLDAALPTNAPEALAVAFAVS